MTNGVKKIHGGFDMTYNKRIMALIAAMVSVLVMLGACSESDAAREAPDEVPDKEAEVSEEQDAETGEKTGKKIYFAAPMFSQSEKDYNLMVVKVLEDHGYTVFLPQRDGLEAPQLEGKTEEEKTEMIFKLDHDEVIKADIVFMNMDGRVPDEGACVELGMAYEAGKRCYGFKTDPRSVELDLDLNPMISGCMIKMFKNYDGDKMIEELEEYLDKNEL